MGYAVVILLSLLSCGAATGENKAIKVENIQEVCAAIDGVSRHIETSLSGSSCVYRVNGSNACKNCLDLNCSAVLTYLSARFTFTSEVSVLPCHDGNLDIPTHAINSRIMGPDGRIIFDRLSTRSFVESRVVQVLLISVRVHISANIENRGNGIFFQVNVTAVGRLYEGFPPTFIPITCTAVDRSVCFGSTMASGKTSAATSTSTIVGIPTSTNVGTPTPSSKHPRVSTATPPSTDVAPTATPPSTDVAPTATPPSTDVSATPASGNAGAPTAAAAVWTLILLAILSLVNLHC